MRPTAREHPNFVTHLECSSPGNAMRRARSTAFPRQDAPLLVRYDLDALGRHLRKEDLASREDGFWRYREFLPVTQSKNVVALGEVITPLIPPFKDGRSARR